MTPRTAAAAVALGALLTSASAACTSPPPPYSSACVKMAKKENSILAGEIAKAEFGPGSPVLIREFDGCDAADSGAWIYAYMDPATSDVSIFRSLRETGWQYGSRSFPGCAEDGCLDGVVKSLPGRRFILARVVHTNDGDIWSTPTNVFLEVGFIDNCWTDDGFTC